MFDRHFELPAHPNLEYYRKQAKHLQHAYETGDVAAQARVADALGDRPAGRFLLSDAQFVLAREHGFRTWAEFRAHLEDGNAAEDRPVSRLMGLGPRHYASMADALLTDLHRNSPGALERLRAYVPRQAAAADPAAAELADARLIIARELGFPTWRELVSFTERSVRELDERKERQRRLRPQAEALLAGDARLARLTADQADTLLQMLAYREALPGAQLGEELGVPRAGVDVLIGQASNLNIPLTGAAFFNRVEYVRLLLNAGADPGTRARGITPLENAIYNDATQVVDLLAERGIVPQALWTYAACGRLDLVRDCFDADGGLRPEAASSRPNPADILIGFPPRIEATDDPAEIVAEAFVHACQHGRTEVVRWFLDHGVNPDVAPYFGRTGLHWAIPYARVEVIRLLLERGADASLRDELFQADADAWLRIFFATRWDDPVTKHIHGLIESRSG